MEIKPFGDYLRSLRANVKKTVREVAEESQVSASYITNVENGKRGIPSPDILLKLSKPLAVDYNNLMEMAGYIKSQKEIDSFFDVFDNTEVKVIFKEKIFEHTKDSNGVLITREVSRQEIVNRHYDIGYILKHREKALLNGDKLTEQERKILSTIVEATISAIRKN